MSHLVGNVVVLVQEHLQLADADPQVSISEIIGDVEAQRAKLRARDGVAGEQAQGQEQALERRSLDQRRGGGGRAEEEEDKVLLLLHIQHGSQKHRSWLVWR